MSNISHQKIDFLYQIDYSIHIQKKPLNWGFKSINALIWKKIEWHCLMPLDKDLEAPSLHSESIVYYKKVIIFSNILSLF
jgi:hypothetical protein